MRKRFVIATAKQGMSRAEFQTYWSERHGPLVAGMPGYWDFTERYIQNHTLDTPAYGVPVSQFDGVMETWLREDHGHKERLFAETPAYMEHVRPDEANFIDPTGCTVMEADTNVIIDGPREGYKMLSFMRRRPDISHDAFVEHYRTIHAGIVLASQQIMSYIPRYVQHYVIPGTQKQFGTTGEGQLPQFDAVKELWFRSLEDIETMFATEDYKTKLNPDEPNFILLGGSTRFMLKEIEITPESARKLA